jgi:hypothetical protein
MNKTEKTRFTAVIRFIIKRRKVPDSMRIVETAMGLASLFSAEKQFFSRPRRSPSLLPAGEGRLREKTTLGKRPAAS